MGMFSPYNNREEWVCTNDHPLWSEQEIEFDFQSMTTIFIDEWVNPGRTLSHKYFDEEPSVFALGDSVISFLDIDFSLYNTILNDYVSSNDAIYFENHGCELLDCFIYRLYENGIDHLYFDSLNKDYFFNMRLDEFKKIMYIDPEIIECIHRFIDGLCGMPYHVEHLNEKGANAVDALSDDIDILFSDMPFMKEKHYCESIINRKTHIIQGCKFGKRYINNHPLSFCVTELSKMIEANVIIKRCKNCGKYFIQKQNYNNDYCNRKYNQKGQTCKDIGASLQYKNKINNNPILKEYERAYKRYYARVTNNKMSTEDFRLWTEEASKKRDCISAEYKIHPSDQLIADFKHYLGNK